MNKMLCLVMCHWFSMGNKHQSLSKVGNYSPEEPLTCIQVYLHIANFWFWQHSFASNSLGPMKYFHGQKNFCPSCAYPPPAAWNACKMSPLRNSIFKGPLGLQWEGLDGIPFSWKQCILWLNLCRACGGIFKIIFVRAAEKVLGMCRILSMLPGPFSIFTLIQKYRLGVLPCHKYNSYANNSLNLF